MDNEHEHEKTRSRTASVEYDASFKCTYNLIEDDAEESDDLYRCQFLQAFCLEDWNSIKINNTMEYVFLILAQTTEGKEIIKLAQQKYNMDDDGVTPFLFSYDNFYLFHDCLIEIISKKKIEPPTFEAMINKLTTS